MGATYGAAAGTKAAWLIAALAQADALIALLEVELAQVVFRHQLEEILDRPDVERPGRVPFVVGHSEPPDGRHPGRRPGSGY